MTPPPPTAMTLTRQRSKVEQLIAEFQKTCAEEELFDLAGTSVQTLLERGGKCRTPKWARELRDAVQKLRRLEEAELARIRKEASDEHH